MSRKVIWKLIVSLLILVGLGFMAVAKDGPYGELTPVELKAQLDHSDWVVVDVRSGGDWNSSDQKIKGAIRVERGEESVLSERYGKDKTFVFYCS